MNRRKITLFFLVSMMVFLALPAAAWNKKDSCNGAWIRWRLSEETLNVSAGISQFYTSEWRESIEAAQRGWNQAPASNFEIYTRWTLGSVHGVSGDGSDDLVMPSSWNYNGYAAVTKHRWSDCSWWPDVAHYTEVDVLLNPDARNWDKSTNPVPSDTMKNTTLILQHEFGHVLGLDDENGMLATMNSGFPGPMGGPIGNNNAVQPLGNDLQGVRNGYGYPGDGRDRDVAASAVYYVGSGVSKTIPAPSSVFRGSAVSFQFTILNRGKTAYGQETIPVYFYLSADRNVTTADMFLGNATIKLADERSTTGYVTLTIPDYAPAGNQYLGWYTDPDNVIPETDELNNGVALVTPTYVSPNRMPIACFTATPSSGYVPLNVSLDAGCSTDADGDLLTYNWEFSDGSTATGRTLSHTFFYAGYHQVLLTVTDPSGASTWTYRYISASCREDRFCPEEPY